MIDVSVIRLSNLLENLRVATYLFLFIVRLGKVTKHISNFIKCIKMLEICAEIPAGVQGRSALVEDFL